MNPLEQFTLAQLRERTSEKWTNYSSDILPLWVAEMDVKLPEQLVAAMTLALRNGDTGYLSLSGFKEYASSFANFASRHWQWETEPESFADVPDVVSGCRKVIDAWLEHNSENSVIVSTPIYPPFMNNYARGYRFVDAPLTSQTSPTPFRLDFGKIENAFENATKNGKKAVYALCNPSNPTGTVHSYSELKQLSVLSKKYGVLVVSDEIHAPLVTARNFEHDDHSISECENPERHGKHSSFVPYLSIDGVDFGVSVVSASKAFSIPAMKAALVIPAKSESATNLIWHSGNFRQASSEQFGALSQTICLNEADEWLWHLVQGLRNNATCFKALAAENFPKAKVHCGDGTYFAWIDFSEYVDSRIIPCDEFGIANPAKWLRENAKVALNPGRSFALPMEISWSGIPKNTGDCEKTKFDNFVRLNFATSGEILRLAATQIKEALR